MATKDSTFLKAPSSEEEAQLMLRNFIHGYQFTQVVYVIAELGIPDLLDEGAFKTADELAQATSSDSESLYRLLSAGASTGFFIEKEKKFALGPMGKFLRSDHPRSQRSMARLNGGARFKGYAHLLEGVKTGKAPVQIALNQPYYEYLNSNPTEAQVFNQSMTQYFRPLLAAVLDSYPSFVDGSTVVDVGGGEGTFLLALKRRFPNIKPILADIDVTIKKTEAQEELKLVQKVAINFLESVPAGGDYYILKNVVHDHSDEDIRKLFTSVAKALPERNGKLLIIERMFPSETESAQLTKWIDITFFVLNEGKVRSVDRLKQLASECGLQASAVIPVKNVPETFILELSLINKSS